jgi:hypothetical protein
MTFDRSRIATASLLAATLVAAAWAQAKPSRSSDPARPSPAASLRGGQAAAVRVQGLERFMEASIAAPLGTPEEAVVAVPTERGEVSLQLRQWSVRDAGFMVLLDRGDGQLHEAPVPPSRTYRGEVEGVPGSLVAASIVEGQLWAVAHYPNGESLIVEPVDPLAPAGRERSRHLVYFAADTRSDGRGCGNDLFDMAASTDGGVAGGDEGGTGGEGGTAGTDLWLVRIGCDADFEFLQKNGGSVAQTVNDIENIINNVDLIYTRDTQITYEISAIVVRTVSGAPYAGTNIDAVLCEFRNTWNTAPENAIPRNIAQHFSGKNFGSTIGLAWLNTICNANGSDCGSFGNLGYSVVESRYSTSLNFRLSLSAHELGHNWSAQHCSGSTCHIMCASNGGCGGVSGSNLKFGPTSINTIVSRRNAVTCDTLLPPPIALPFIETVPVSTVSLDRWIYNQGVATSTNSVNPPSPTRAFLLNAAGSGLYQKDDIRSNFMLLGGITEPVELIYWSQHRGVEAGESLVVEYANNLNRWVAINTIVSDGTDQTEFTEHRHVLPANARHNRFRIRFRAQVDESNDFWFVDDIVVRLVPPIPVPPNNECVNATAAGDGSTSFTTVGSSTSGPSMPFSCGNFTGWEMLTDVWFAHTASCTGVLRVDLCDAAFDSYVAVYAGSACPTEGTAPIACNDDFFGCGTGARVLFETTAGQTYRIRVGSAVPNSTGTGVLAITCTPDDPPIPGDINGDGVVNGADLGQLLTAWGACGSPQNCPADLNGDGTVDGADLGILLTNWTN